MTDSILQIAECLDSLRAEVEALGVRVANAAIEGEHVRLKLGDYATVLLGLHARLIAISPGDELPAADPGA